MENLTKNEHAALEKANYVVVGGWGGGEVLFKGVKTVPASDSITEQTRGQFEGFFSADIEDAEGESMDQAGMNWTNWWMPFGHFKWEHQDGPENWIGEPDRNKKPVIAKTKEGYTGTRGYGELYISSDKRAAGIYRVGKEIQANSPDKAGQVGFSIEGSAQLRDKRNRKRVLKCLVRDVAIVSGPLAFVTRMDLVKGLAIAGSMEDERSMSQLISAAPSTVLRYLLDQHEAAKQKATLPQFLWAKAQVRKIFPRADESTLDRTAKKLCDYAEIIEK